MGDPDRGKKLDPFTLFLTVACLALVVLVLLLARQNVRLKKELGSFTAGGAEEVHLEGEVFPALTLFDAGGTDQVVDFGGGEAGKQTLLLIFSSQCPACVQTIPLWEEVFAGLGNRPEDEPGPVQVLAIQTDMPDPQEPEGEAGGMLTAAMPFQVFGFRDPATSKELARVPYIPAALLLDSGGTVVRTWIGVPDDTAQDELRRLIE